jgi:pimeloyl-ACP methyl ester carboxylesterase
MTALRSPVVMIHGAFCGGWVFDHWRAAFEAKGYAVQAPTLRYHACGDDPPPELGTTSVRDYADDVERLIAGSAFAADPGRSFDGRIDRADACGPQRDSCSRIAGAFRTLGRVAVDSVRIRVRPGALSRRRFLEQNIAADALDRGGERARSPAARRARCRVRAFRAGIGTCHFRSDALAARFQTRTTQVDPRDVTCPVLCLVGAKDRVNPPATVRRVATRYGGRARYEELAGHSHWLIGEPGWEKVAARAACVARRECVPDKGRRAKVTP